MMEKAKTIVIIILFLATLILSVICLYQSRRQVPPEVIQVIQRDTITITKDSIIQKTLWKTKLDTFLLVQHDTIIDTLFVELPIEHKVSQFNLSKDSFSMKQKIYHSGFISNIDSVQCEYDFHYTEVLPKKEKKIGFVWNIGFYAGYGACVNNGQIYFSPEIGIGGSIGIGGKLK